jgi:hypothetical protein
MTTSILALTIFVMRLFVPSLHEIAAQSAGVSSRPGFLSKLGLMVLVIFFGSLFLSERASRGLEAWETSVPRSICLAFFVFACVMSLPALRSNAGAFFAIAMHASILVAALVLAPEADSRNGTTGVKN